MNSEVSESSQHTSSSFRLENRDELVQSIASKIYQSFVDVNNDLKGGPLDQGAVQRIISEAVASDKSGDHVYQSNCVVESKKYFGDSFEPALHNSELNYEDLPRPVTEFNRTAATPNGKKVKDNVLQFLEKGKQRLLFQQSNGGDDGSVASDPPTPKGRRKMTGKWDQVRQKIFPAKKSNSQGKKAGWCVYAMIYLYSEPHKKSGPPIT